MPFQGNGTFSVVYNFGADAAAGIKILASRQDTQWNDVATNGLSNVICKDGQTTTTAAIPFASGITLSGGPTLSTYATGTWTPVDASGAALVFTTALGRYTKVGRLVFVSCIVGYPVTADVAAAFIGGLPFTASNAIAGDLDGMTVTATDVGAVDLWPINRNTTIFGAKSTTALPLSNNRYSGKSLTFFGCYTATA